MTHPWTRPCTLFRQWIGIPLALIAILVFPACNKIHSSSAGKQVVNLAIWSNYVKPAVLTEFQKRTGIKVQVSNYSSNEELLAKLQAGAGGYDVAVPSDYMVFAMIKLGLLKPLDKTLIPNAKEIDSRYLGKSYDPKNQYSLPYDVGTTGIAINRSLYKGKIRSWMDLFTKPDLAGKLTLLDDPRETIGAALKALGYSLNTRDPAQLKKAKQLLLKVRPRLKGFTSEPLMPLVNGETAVAQAYSSDALQASRQTGGKIQYIIPKEGATFWIDNLVIPVGAQNVHAAHELINYLLDPKIAAQTTVSVLVAPSNREAVRLLPKKLQSNPELFPKGAVFKKLEMIQDVGSALRLWDRTWTEVKASE